MKQLMILNPKYEDEGNTRNETGSAEILVSLGIGLLAGAVGTAVMTVAQMIEMKITGRESSDTP